MVNRAVELYGNREANCAQSIARAWQEKQGEGQWSAQLNQGLHGRSAEGTCGALHAACLIAGPQKAPRITGIFQAASGGHTSCRDLRSKKAMSCLECVRVAAEALATECGNP